MKPAIHATYDLKAGTWEITSNFGSLVAEDLVLSVGWGDIGAELEHSRHVAIAIARKQDQTYTVVWECQTQAAGDLRDLGRQLIDAKDLLKSKRLFLDKTQPQNHDYLRRIDGLTHYETIGENSYGRVVYAQEKDVWPFFAGWDQYVSLVAIPESIILKFQTHQAEVQYMIGTGKLKTGRRTPELMVALALPPNRWEQNPYCKALVYGIAKLLRENQKSTNDHVRDDTWYKNR